MSERIPHEVLAAFGLEPDAIAMRLSGGHIHRTWRVGAPGAAVVLQRLSATVFPEPRRVVENAVAVTRHLERKRDDGSYPLEVPAPVAAADGEFSVVASDGALWRAWRHLEDTRTVSVVDSVDQARETARAYGLFDAALADLGPATLAVVLPHFHDLGWRLGALRAAADEDPRGRAERAAEPMAFCLAQAPLAEEIAHLVSRLPPVVCHNDTKTDNVLFDLAGRHARAVIDLDTCMPGHRMFDFGDMVRSCCSPEPEDSTRLEAVRVREDVFAGLADGFLDPLAPHLTRDETATLWAGARAVCLAVGVRFLTDWIEGDRYFATSRPDHNLDRARNQLALYRDLCGRERALRPLLSR